MARFTPEPFSPWVHMRNFSPVSEITLKRPKILGTSYGANFEKQRKHKNYREFASFIAMATLIAVSLQLNGMLIVWKIQHAMGRCRPGRQNSSRFHPGNRAEVFIWPKNFRTLTDARSRLEKRRSRELSQPALSYDHIENFIKDLEVRRDLGKPGQLSQPGSSEAALRISSCSLKCARVVEL